MKDGDSVICVYNKNGGFRISISKTYIIKDISNNSFLIENDYEVGYYYPKDCFLSVKNYRKKKLEKLNCLCK